MDELESQQIREIVRQVIKEEQDLRIKDEFYINRKQLYDVHQRTVTLLGVIDNVSSVIGKTIVYSIIIGLASIAVWVLSGKIR